MKLIWMVLVTYVSSARAISIRVFSRIPTNGTKITNHVK